MNAYTRRVVEKFRGGVEFFFRPRILSFAHPKRPNPFDGPAEVVRFSYPLPHRREEQHAGHVHDQYIEQRAIAIFGIISPFTTLWLPAKKEKYKKKQGARHVLLSYWRIYEHSFGQRIFALDFIAV